MFYNVKRMCIKSSLSEGLGEAFSLPLWGGASWLVQLVQLVQLVGAFTSPLPSAIPLYQVL